MTYMEHDTERASERDVYRLQNEGRARRIVIAIAVAVAVLFVIGLVGR